MTEKELLLAIKRDPAQFARLFTLYHKPIFGYVFRRIGHFEDAADLAAETFFKAFRHICRFAYTGIPVRVWLYRIATNEVNQYFRKKRNRSSLLDRFDGNNKQLMHQYLLEDKSEAEAELQKHEQFLQVLQQVRKLPVKYQEVITLKFFEGKTHREIAEILGVKEGTLKSLLSRGIQKIRQEGFSDEFNR